MDRPQRKRIVMAAAAGLVSLFMAMIGVPLLAMPFAPEFDFGGPNAENFFKSSDALFQFIHLVNYISLAFLVIAGGCLIYLLVMFAIRFIGPKEDAETYAEQHVNLPIE